MAQRERNIPADVEVIEQRAALRDQAELTAIEIELGGDDLEARCHELGALEQHARERGLAGARAAEQDDDLARCDVEIDAVDQRAPVGEHDAEPAHPERRHARTVASDTVAPTALHAFLREPSAPFAV
jgi:hypothetical protein